MPGWLEANNITAGAGENIMNECICVDDAHWDISLDVTCPHCEHYFDVTDYISMIDLPDIKAQDELCLEIVCAECSRYFRIVEITIS